MKSSPLLPSHTSFIIYNNPGLIALWAKKKKRNHYLLSGVREYNKVKI